MDVPFRSDPDLAELDPQVARLVLDEFERQASTISLIPSENHVSRAVLQAAGSVFTNKYSEGYAGRRYYEGQQIVDRLEPLAIERAKQLFGVDHVNVQPYSGSPANLAIYLAFCDPGDTVLGMSLPMGGHLTHGWNVSVTGRWFHAVQYGVRRETGRVDLDEVRELARAHRPKLIFCGGTAIPRTIDFPGFAEIAREVGSVLVADIAHVAGLIAGGAHPSPVGHAEVISTTTHKTLRGPRGAMRIERPTPTPTSALRLRHLPANLAGAVRCRVHIDVGVAIVEQHLERVTRDALAHVLREIDGTLRQGTVGDLLDRERINRRPGDSHLAEVDVRRCRRTAEPLHRDHVTELITREGQGRRSRCLLRIWRRFRGPVHLRRVLDRLLRRRRRAAPSRQHRDGCGDSEDTKFHWTHSLMI